MPATERRRWDTDERFSGVRDASAASPDIERLLTLAAEPGWITEDADAHLGPSVRAVAESLAVELVRLEVVDDILEIDVRLPKGSGSTAQQAVAFALVGAFAEPSTHVRQAEPDPRWRRPARRDRDAARRLGVRHARPSRPGARPRRQLRRSRRTEAAAVRWWRRRAGGPPRRDRPRPWSCGRSQAGGPAARIPCTGASASCPCSSRCARSRPTPG